MTMPEAGIRTAAEAAANRDADLEQTMNDLAGGAAAHHAEMALPAALTDDGDADSGPGYGGEQGLR